PDDPREARERERRPGDLAARGEVVDGDPLRAERGRDMARRQERCRLDRIALAEAAREAQEHVLGAAAVEARRDEEEARLHGRDSTRTSARLRSAETRWSAS